MPRNIANADTIGTDETDPYQRRVVTLSAVGQNQTFEDYLNGKLTTPGVEVSAVETDASPFRTVYDPENPYADENGYVTMSNVDTTREILDLLSASRAYEANLTVLNATKSR